jgi:hypothetical protein
MVVTALLEVGVTLLVSNEETAADSRSLGHQAEYMCDGVW